MKPHKKLIHLLSFYVEILIIFIDLNLLYKFIKEEDI